MGFRDFVLRGNVVELAVAVVIGAAFSKVVTTVTDRVLQPLIAAAGGGSAGEGLGFRVRSGNPATFVDLGALITSVLNFVIVAAVVYFAVVVPMNALQARRRAAAEPDAHAAPADVALLREIRDLLRAQARP